MDNEGRDRVGAVVLLAAAMLWAGMLVGVSFIATPVKFRAPSLALPVALDVGRYTFAWFSRIEIGAGILLALLVGLTRATRLGVAAMAVAGTIVILDTVWFLPLLDQRTALVIAGGVPEPSSLHGLYIDLEALKLLSLLLLAATAARRATRAI